MDFITYNEKAMRTANKSNSWSDTLVNCALGISGEAGEIADHIKKARFHNHTIDMEKILLELGDCLYYLNWLADTLGYSLEDVAEMNIIKLQKRYPDRFSYEASQNREEYAT